MADVRITQYPQKIVIADDDIFLIADSNDVDVNGFLKYKKVKAKDLPSIVNTAENITYANLIGLMAANGLITSTFYRITNSTSGVSPLLVQAVSNSTISYQAFDGANPLNTINYDVTTDTIRWNSNQSVAPVPSTRTITAGTGLTGGGDLTANRTFAIDSTVATLTGTQTLTNKTITSPVINEILDSNGNEILGFTPIASATDYITIKNGIGVGVPLHISAAGSSANTGLHLEPKGTGLVQISDGIDATKGIRFRSSGSAASAVTLIDAVSSAGRVITLPNATGTVALTSDLSSFVTGSGTTNFLPKFTGASALGNSLLQEGTSAIGLGVTPLAWNASFRALQIGTKTALWDTGGATQLSYNAYNDGANKYLTTGLAMRYFITDSGHTWSTAASGTAGGALTFTSAMTLDASGNLGLGITPSAWSGFKALEIGAVGNSLWSAGSNDIRLNTNYVFDVSGKYAGTGFATQYQQTIGQHRWFTAPSGTAGNAITFTQAMTLDASGNLAIGTTTAATKLDVKGSVADTAVIGGVTVEQTTLFRPSNDSGGIRTGFNTTGGNAYIWSSSSGASLNFGTRVSPNNNVGMTLLSSGNFGIGTTAPASKLEVQVATAGTSIIGFFNNTDLTVANKSAIRVRQQTGASTGFSAYFGMDGNTLFLSNDTTATNHLTISTTGAATFSADATINGLTVGRGVGNIATNTAVGASALNANTTGATNTAVGVNALTANTTGSQNTSVGVSSLSANNTGSQNTAIGRSALFTNTTGANNTALGYQALNFNSIGSNNTALGAAALLNNTANNATAVGFEAATNNTTGAATTAIGYQALKINSTGANNTAVGSSALGLNTTGQQNTSVGSACLVANTTGNDNTAIGVAALGAVTTASNNTAIGRLALGSNTAANNTAVGFEAASGNTTATGITAIGHQALKANTTGAGNTAVGGSHSGFYNAALSSNTTGSNNVAVGSALTSNITGSSNVSVGWGSSVNNTAGSNNTALGTNALQNNTASNNTAVGFEAAKATTSGTLNTAIGVSCLISNTTGGSNTALGRAALQSLTTASNNTAVGVNALQTNTAANNTAFGYEAALSNTSGTGITAIGYQALRLSTGANNTALGFTALAANTTGIQNTALGSQSLQKNTTGISNIGIGLSALLNNLVGNSNIGIGVESLLNSTGNNNIAIGTSALSLNTAANNTALGFEAAKVNTTGTGITAIGYQSLVANTTGANNTGLGNSALIANTTGNQNTAIGVSALAANTTGGLNTAVGLSSLSGNTSGQYNTAVGYNTQSGNFSSSVILGRDAAATAANQFVIGSASYPAGAVATEVVVSDRTWAVKINGTDYKILLKA